MVEWESVVASGIGIGLRISVIETKSRYPIAIPVPIAIPIPMDGLVKHRSPICVLHLVSPILHIQFHDKD
jgi:hypothetical protein